MRFLWRTTPEVSSLAPATYTDAPPLQCAFTTRHAGTSGRTLNLSVDLGQRVEVLANRQRVLDALGLAHSTLSTVRQVHGNHVCVVDAHVVQHGLRGVEGDALVTALPGVPLGVLVADCLPIMLYTSQPPVVAMVHAGRMGTYHQVVGKTLEVLQERFAVTPSQVHAVMGPAIGACCYTLDIHAVGPTDRQNKRHFRLPTPVAHPPAGGPSRPRRLPCPQRAAAARRSGVQQSVERLRAAWTGSAGWVKITPQGCSGVKASRRAVGWGPTGGQKRRRRRAENAQRLQRRGGAYHVACLFACLLRTALLP